MLVRHGFMHAPFTVADAERSGVSTQQLARLEERGELTRVFRGVYVCGDVPVDTSMRLRALHRIAPPMLVLIERTAALVHGLDLYTVSEHAAPLTVECCVLRGRFPPRRQGLTMTRRDLSPEEMELVDGLRVTTPMRTALDLVCSLPRQQALWAVDALSARHGLTRDALSAELVRFGRRRGVVQARKLVPLVDPGSESSGESFTRLALIEAGLPAPVTQHWVYDDGSPRYRLDLAYPWAKVAIEYDGQEHHSTLEQREHDRRRREWLRSRGWTVIVVDRHGFRDDARQTWINDVCRALGRP